MDMIVILAGGKSSRMKTDKLKLAYDGKTILARAVDAYSACFDRVFISVSAAGKYPEYVDIELADLIPGKGPVSGLYTALSICDKDSFVFLVAADMPFSDPSAAKRMLDLCRQRRSLGAAVFWQDGRSEPLFSCYSPALLPHTKEIITGERHNLTPLLSLDGFLHISAADIGILHPEDHFFNVNRPEDYLRLNRP